MKKRVFLFFVLIQSCSLYAAENTEELMREFIWHGSYPIESISMMYYENFVPGEGYDGESHFDTVRVVHEDDFNLSKSDGDQLSDFELQRFKTHTRVRKLYLNRLQDNNWVRLDSVWIPNEKKGDFEYINKQFEKPQILISGPKGDFRYESEYKNGMIHRRLSIKYPALWQWGLIPLSGEGRGKNAVSFDDSSIKEEINNQVKHTLRFASSAKKGDAYHLNITVGSIVRDTILKKEWNYLPSKVTFLKQGSKQNEYEFVERELYKEGNYYFPTKAIRREHLKENELVNYELNIEVINYNLWCDMPEDIYEVPFEKGTRVIDMSNAVEQRRPDRLQWTEDNKDFIRNINIEELDKVK